MHRPEEMFERIVTQVLQSRGLSSTGLAAHRRERGSFAEALRFACQEVGLKPADAAPRRKRAHDEGVDILCHFGWEEDLRPGTISGTSTLAIVRCAKVPPPVPPRPVAVEYMTLVGQHDPHPGEGHGPSPRLREFDEPQSEEEDLDSMRIDSGTA